MRQAVDAVVDQLPGILQVEDVGSGAKVTLVGAIDDRLGDVVWHFLLRPQMIVHP